MHEEEKDEAIAQALHPILRDGDAYQVYCIENEVYVTEANTSVCAARHPKLYGRLLSLSSVIEHSAEGYVRYPLLFSATFCVGVHLHWWDQWLGAETVTKLDSAWFFVLVLFLMVAVLQSVITQLHRKAYARGRAEVLDMMRAAGLDRDSLVTLLEGDKNVMRVSLALELDHEAGRYHT